MNIFSFSGVELSKTPHKGKKSALPLVGVELMTLDQEFKSLTTTNIGHQSCTVLAGVYMHVYHSINNTQTTDIPCYVR